MRIFKIWFALSLVLATSMSLQAKKVRLKYNFEKGTVFNCEYVVTQDITQEVMGQSQSTHSMT
ncbi:MAG: hypothetical protein J7L96_01495, partial [Bacteroidales bacterium]|nr:hypothetical protein [Bacteroidales bacterium]